ncbi:MAG: gliding motility-associated C-terminal domain-containing protein [Saprospiraceae bacterium]|nr:gliding motility-associated C-terminal domain-containing protein [Saprospiraceae bacterium]
MSKKLSNLVMGVMLLFSTLSSIAQPTFSITPVTIASQAVGTTVECFVTVKDFTNISGFGHEVNWNAQVLQFQSVQSLMTDSGLLFNQSPTSTNLGKLPVSWLDPQQSANGVTLSNNTNIYKITFSVLQAASSTIGFAATPRSVVSSALQEFPGTYQSAVYGSGVVVPNQSNFEMSIGDGSGASGTQVCVPVVVRGFNDMVAVQYSLHWSPTVIRFDSISGLNLPYLTTDNINTNNAVSNGDLSFSWSDDTVEGVTVNDGTTIFNLCFTLLGGSGANTPIQFTNTPTIIEASQNVGANTQVTPFTTDGGIVSVTSGSQVQNVSIKGTSEIAATGSQACVSVLANSGFTSIDRMQFSINYNPSILQFSNVGTFGLTGLDAADFNTSSATSGSISVNWTNATGVTVANNTALFDVCFNVLGSSGSNSQVTFSGSPTPIVFENESNTTVVFSSTPGLVTVAGSFNGLTISASDETATVGSQVCFDITPTNFVNIVSLQYRMSWDSTKLQYVGIQGLNSSISDLSVNNFNEINNGTLSFSWFDQSVVGVSVPNDAVIYQACFNVLADGCNNLNFFGTTSDPIEASNNLGVVAVNTVAGSINCGVTPTPTGCDHSNGFYLYGTTVSAQSGQVGCIDVKVNDFNNITSAQTLIQYDPSKLQYQSVQGIDLVDFSSASLFLFSPGNLRLSWLQNEQTGVTKADGSTIFQLCFTNLAANVDSSAINFTGNASFPYEVSDVTSVPVTPHGCPGYIKKTTDVVNPDPLALSAVVTGFCQPESTGGGGTVTIPTCNGFSGFGLNMDRVDSSVGSIVSIGSKVNGFVNMISMQYTIKWDPTKLEFQSTTNYNTAAGISAAAFGTTNALSSGVINFSWFDPSPTFTGVTLPDGTSLYDIKFKVLTADTASIRFANAPTTIEITDLNNNLISASSLSQCYGYVNATSTGGGGTQVVNNNGAINLSVSGGTPNYTYVWSNGASTQDLSGLSQGTYVVTVTDNTNVTSTASYYVGVLAITDTIVSPSTSGNNGSININVIGGSYPSYTYLWSNGAVTQDIANLAPNTYTVTVTDLSGCTKTATFVVTNNLQPLSAVVTNVTNVLCYNNSTGAIDITVSGGSGSYSYSWIRSGSQIATTQDISSVIAGSYQVIVTDNSSSNTTTLNVVIPQPSSPLTINANVTGSSVSGNNGSIVINATGGTPYTNQQTYNYVWSHTGFNTNAVVNLSANSNYCVTVSDANSCTATYCTVIPVVTAVTITSSQVTNVNCGGFATGAIDLAVSSNCTNLNYSWTSTTGVALPNQQDLTNLTAGTYFVTVTDCNNFTSTAQIIVQDMSPQLNVVVDQILPQVGQAKGSIYITVSPVGVYNFHWNDGLSSTNEDQISAVNAGEYMVSITVPSSQCLYVFGPYTVGYQPATQPTLLDTTVIGSCNAGTNGQIIVEINGGDQPYTFEWADGVTLQNATRPNLAPGFYTVTVRDSNDIVAVNNLTIEVPAIAIEANYTTTPSTSTTDCNGSINLTPFGNPLLPLQYVWNQNGCNGTNTSQDLSCLCPGQYQVTITDGNGCTYESDLIEVQGPLAVDATITPTACPSESIGAINLNISGGCHPLGFLWSNGAVSQSISGLVEGTYSVTITDCSSNTSVHSYNVPATSTLTSVIGLTHALSSANSNDGALKVTITGATLPIVSLTWSNGQTTEEISGLSAGIYSVTVVDATGCAVIREYDLTSSTILTVNITTEKYNGYDLSCYDECDGIASAEVAGGSPNYTYIWSNGNTEATISNLCAGNYRVTVTDGLGNSATKSIQMIAPPNIIVNFDVQASSGLPDGSARAIVVGGTAPLTYQWSSNNDADEILQNVAAGEYFVLITDNNGCRKLASIEIPGPEDGTPCSKIMPAFSPNDDGANDLLLISCLNTQNDFNLEIYNRWGQLVYRGDRSSISGNVTWDGKNLSGELQPEGAYFYVIDVKEVSGTRSQYKGSFVLIK